MKSMSANTGQHNQPNQSIEIKLWFMEFVYWMYAECPLVAPGKVMRPGGFTAKSSRTPSLLRTATEPVAYALLLCREAERVPVTPAAARTGLPNVLHVPTGIYREEFQGLPRIEGNRWN